MSLFRMLRTACSACRAGKIYLGSSTCSRSFESLTDVTPFGYPRACASGPFWSSWKTTGPVRRYGNCAVAAMASYESKAASLAKVAVGQMTSVGDQEANFATCQRLAFEAKDAGCCMLFLPECCSFIGRNQQETVSAGQPLNGPAMAKYRELARETKLWLSLGGFQEKGPDSEHIYNTHVILNAEGEIASSYRKVHLFNVEVHNGPVLMEGRSTAPGTQLAVCDSPAGRLGLTVCYDLRFPEVYQRLAFDHGAEVMLVPSAFTKATGEAHWELLLRARAVETQSFVIAAAQAGKHNEKRESYGHSLICDPWGDVIARLEDPHETGIALAELDFERMAKIRERMPIKNHREQGRKSLQWT